ncbi:MAG TPA: tetratricopeptide repeat protein [Chitinophagaceae bacterium]|nr:tetratricopeptide repeat protein [Chitinophagaceae bacterium]
MSSKKLKRKKNTTGSKNISTAQNVPRQKANRSTPVSQRNNYIAVFIILLFTFIAYLPSLKAGFVNWDDPDYVNEQIFRQGFSNLKNLITTPVQGNYHPLTMISLALNYSVSGMNAWSYHLLNLLLHLINCILVFRFALLLSNRNAPIAFVTAILFGIHPMHVESVAWVTERKDVLYGLFFIAGLISYTKYTDTGSRKQYIITLIFLILALLSKPAAVVFPLVLFCIDLLRRRKLALKLFLEKIPFFVLPLILGFITFLAQKEKGAMDTYVFGIGTRIFMGFYGIMMYFIKMIVPINLSPFYPYAPINQSLPTEYYLAPLFFVALAIMCIYSWKRNRVVAFGILFYIINLLLVVQFLPVGSAIIADRYTYIPYIGLFFIIGWLINRFAKGSLLKVYYIIIPVSVLFSFLTYQQSAVWSNSASLWDHAIKITPSSRAYDNRAGLFNDEKDFTKALEYYTEALKLNAIDKEAYTNRGNIYFNSVRVDLAYQDYKKALSIDPRYYSALDNLGALFAMRGQYDSALTNLNRALSIKPDYISSYRNRGLVFMELKRYNEAINDFESFLKYQPGDPDIYNAIGICYRSKENYQESVIVINKALAIKQDPHFYLNRSYCYYGLKNIEQAKKDALAAKQGGIKLDLAYAKELSIQ